MTARVIQGSFLGDQPKLPASAPLKIKGVVDLRCRQTYPRRNVRFLDRARGQGGDCRVAETDTDAGPEGGTNP
jgi:hypothetical protein